MCVGCRLPDTLVARLGYLGLLSSESFNLSRMPMRGQLAL